MRAAGIGLTGASMDMTKRGGIIHTAEGLLLKSP
jgi:hypothetical protein